MVKTVFFLKQIACFIVVFLMLAACKPKVELDGLMSGELKLQRFVSIGDGHTAGFMDDALYQDGQWNSLGAILQGQLQLVGASQVYMPLTTSSNIGVNSGLLARLILGYKNDCNGVSNLSPVRFSLQGEQGVFSTSVYNSQQKFSNWGVPGLRMIDLTASTFGTNPFFARMSKDQYTLPASGSWSSVQENIMDSENPTFCSIYLDLEDFLPFAKSGATTNPMSPLVGPAGQGFDESVHFLLDQLSSQGGKGVIATLPSISQLPYFTTITYNGLILDSAKAASLNQIYGPLGFAFSVGANPFMIEDPSAGNFGVRPIQEGELLVLRIPLDSVRCYQMGSIYPFRDEFVITSDELQEINSRVLLYNQSIRQWANSFGFGIVELDEFYSKLNDGFIYNGVSMSSKFVSGGVFSLDAIHLNGRGNALLSNVFLTAINKKYQSNIPFVNPLIYSSVYFP